jgi:hypothetical protein
LLVFYGYNCLGLSNDTRKQNFFFFFFFSEGWGCSIHKVELKLLTSRDILADNPYTSHHFWASHCDLRFVLVLAE